jgi:peptide deformylase
MTWQPTLPPFREFRAKNLESYKETSQFIYQLGETDILRKPSIDISIEYITSQEMKEKIIYLKNCLKRYREITGMGRGIAAVQIGIPERFAVIFDNDEMNIIINPFIKKSSDTKLKYPEMCMSCVPVIAPVIRPSWIEFEYFDENAQQQYWKIKDDTQYGKVMNRVFQHEIDHMNGVVNIDKVEKSSDLIMESDPDFYKRAGFEEVK